MSTRAEAAATSTVTSAVTVEPISAQDAAALIESPSAGAVVTFSGDVRDHDHGRTVARLDYEGHPSAADVLSEVRRLRGSGRCDQGTPAGLEASGIQRRNR